MGIWTKGCPECGKSFDGSEYTPEETCPDCGCVFRGASRSYPDRPTEVVKSGRLKDQWKQARKRPVVIHYREVVGQKEVIKTREGEIVGVKGLDYIIKGVDGELYPCKKDIFAKTYDVIEDGEPDIEEEVRKMLNDREFVHDVMKEIWSKQPSDSLKRGEVIHRKMSNILMSEALVTRTTPELQAKVDAHEKAHKEAYERAQRLAELEKFPPRMVTEGSIAGAYLFCHECGEQQFETPSGPVCVNGHGGAPGRPAGFVMYAGGGPRLAFNGGPVGMILVPMEDKPCPACEGKGVFEDDSQMTPMSICGPMVKCVKCKGTGRVQ